MATFQVRPIAHSRTGMLVFVGFLMLVLSAPFLVHWLASPDARLVYRSMPPKYGLYLYVGKELAKTSDIDILVVGDSAMMTAVTPRVLAGALEREHGRPFNVVSFSFNWRGEESAYELVRQTLRRRKVRLILWNETDASSRQPHELAHYFWRAPEQQLPPGPLKAHQHASLYGASVLGVPRLLWSFFISPDDLVVADAFAADVDNKQAAHGFQAEHIGFKSYFDEKERRPFRPIQATPPALPVEEMIFRGKYEGFFSKSAHPYTPYQTYFASLLHDEARRHGTAVASVAFPRGFRGAPLETVAIRDFVGCARPWPVISIAQKTLFGDMPYDEMLDFFTDENHFNENGANLYTAAIAPAVVRVFSQAAVF